MKIHSDTLTLQDVLSAVPSGCYLADPGEKFQGYTNVGIEGSRKRERGYVVRISGSSSYMMQRLPEKAATWDEWGIFIAAIFAHDPKAICGHYKSLKDFIEQTTKEHDRIKQWRRDLLPTHSAPWLAQRSDLHDNDQP
jgi:hypothetical protein